MSKRQKISFQTINCGKVSPIDGNQFTASSHRIKNAMAVVVRDYKKLEATSRIDARKLVLNA
ncbi:hypothetical protein CLV98_102520 [Dyadobacter jejuensis]|uniref:Uncharacterized protein n=1 Tax=Dyadobacter jejuensis TaxID=1082580 RepID=A0A316APG9_9BACT|nr:hypothetical protein CLV98_102520 [Dyadobacter jejuensis]